MIIEMIYSFTPILQAFHVSIILQIAFFFFYFYRENLHLNSHQRHRFISNNTVLFYSLTSAGVCWLFVKGVFFFKFLSADIMFWYFTLSKTVKIIKGGSCRCILFLSRFKSDKSAVRTRVKFVWSDRRISVIEIF